MLSLHHLSLQLQHQSARGLVHRPMGGRGCILTHSLDVVHAVPDVVVLVFQSVNTWLVLLGTVVLDSSFDSILIFKSHSLLTCSSYHQVVQLATWLLSGWQVPSNTVNVGQL